MALLSVRTIICNANHSWLLSRGGVSNFCIIKKSLSSSIACSQPKTLSGGDGAKWTGRHFKSIFRHTDFNSEHILSGLGNRQRLLTFSFPVRRMTSKSSVSGSSSSPETKETLAKTKQVSSTDAVADKKPEEENTTTAAQKDDELSTKDKLKQAVRDYGATVIVFHITMSLASLGFFYLLVKSGLDIMTIIEKIRLAGTMNKIAEGASQFVIAYAIHKIFAPLRITITLGVTPLIVRKLRSMGILKQVVKPKTG